MTPKLQYLRLLSVTNNRQWSILTLDCQQTETFHVFLNSVTLQQRTLKNYTILLQMISTANDFYIMLDKVTEIALSSYT